MKMRAPKYRVLVTCIVIVVTLNIRASENKTLMQDILTNPANRWKNLPQLPHQLIGSMILHNHPIVPFILNRGIVVKTLKDYAGKIISAAFNSEGDMVLTCSTGAVKIWDTSSGKCLSTLVGLTPGYALSAVFNVAGDMVVTWSYYNTPKLWETRSGAGLQDLKGHTGYVYSAAFNNSGDRILTSSSDRTVKLWDTNSGVCLHTLEQNLRLSNPAEFNSSGDLVVTISDKGDTSTVKLWETNSGKCLHTLKGHTGNIWLSKFNSLGDLVFTASCNGTAKLWDTSSGKCLLALKGHTDRIYFAEFNGSEDMIVTGSTYGTAKLWDASSGECLKILDHVGIGSAKFNQLGDRILTRSSDGRTVKLWNTSNGECLQTQAGYPDAINSSIFSSSGEMFITTFYDGTARLWESNTGKCIHTLTGHPAGVFSAVFNGLGDVVLLVGSWQNTVKLYDISLFQKLRNFFSRDDSITLNQAVVLTGIYEIIICRKLVRKKLRFHKLYLRRIKDSLKSLSTSTEEQTISSDRVKFNFLTCPHLQADYEMLPLEIQRILDKYVRKTSSKNDCSTASTTDISDFDSASTSEES